MNRKFYLRFSLRYLSIISIITCYFGCCWLLLTRRSTKHDLRLVDLVPGPIFTTKFNGSVLGRAKLKFSKSSVDWAEKIISSFGEKFSKNVSEDVFQTKPVFVAAFSSNHYTEAKLMLNSFRQVHKSAGFRMTIYDLGLR